MINSQATAQRAPTPGNNHAKITVRDCGASVLDINFPQFDRLPPPAVRLTSLFFFFFFPFPQLEDGCFPILASARLHQYSIKMTDRSVDKGTLAKTASTFVPFFNSRY